jgi:HK97 gp10 family phage protein
MAIEFRINARELDALAAEMAANRSAVLFKVRAATNKAGKAMQRTARSLSKSKSMPGLSKSIYTKTRQLAAGTEITVEAKSPFGFIREFGAGRSGPHPFMLPALEQNLDSWETDMAEAGESVLP